MFIFFISNKTIAYYFLLLIYFALVSMFTGVVYAQSSLSLSEAIQTALKMNPDIAISNQMLQKSKTALKNSRSEFFPRLDIIFNNYYTEFIEKEEPFSISFIDPWGQTHNITPYKNVPDYQSNLSLQLTERLFVGGRVIGTVEGAKSRINLAECQKEIKQRAIILSTIRAYWELRRAEKLVEIAQEKVKHSVSILEVTQKRYEKGAISGLEKETAEVNLVNNRGDLLQAKSTRRDAENRLLLVMGIIGTSQESHFTHLNEPVYEYFKFDEMAINRSIKQAFSSRPEIKRINVQIRIHKADIKIAMSNYYPHIDLVGYYNWIGYSDNSADDSWEDLNRNYWSIGIKVSLNLFQGFATQSEVSQSKSECLASQQELEKQWQIISQEIREAYNSLSGAGERVIIMKKNVTLAEKNLKIAKKQFELGAATINEISEYNLSLADTKQRYFNALIDFEIGKAQLKWAKGERLF